MTQSFVLCPLHCDTIKTDWQYSINGIRSYPRIASDNIEEVCHITIQPNTKKCKALRQYVNQPLDLPIQNISVPKGTIIVTSMYVHVHVCTWTFVHTLCSCTLYNYACTCTCVFDYVDTFKTHYSVIIHKIWLKWHSAW